MTTDLPEKPAQTLATMQSEIASFDTETDSDKILELRNRLDFLSGVIREMKHDLEGVLVEWINKNGDLVINDDTRLYVGTQRRVKCKNNQAVFDKLMESLGGDIEQVLGALSSNAWKHGAAKNILGSQEFETHFEQTILPDVRTGKVRKVVKEFNRQFSRKGIQNARIDAAPTRTPKLN